MSINLKNCETNLKRRVEDVPYIWKRKQNNNFDKLTNSIYQIRSYKELLEIFNNEKEDVKNYAYNRWLNFWSAKAVEEIFINNELVDPEKNKYHKQIDFYIDNIPFDHKTTVLPKFFYNDINNVNTKKFKIELIRWLYKNQSKEQREHYANRIFFVLVNRKNLSESWKLKAELTKIKNEIELYLKEFKKGNKKLITFFDKEKNNRFCSDIIYVFD
tara:strand:- start:13539 stop:14183 length:645 start_codon:yes stop_codon:yes gene_type:complete